MATMAAGASGVRTESDAFGKIDVEGSRYWGAQTQRSLQNFPIGGRESRMPIEIIKGMMHNAATARRANCFDSYMYLYEYYYCWI